MRSQRSPLPFREVRVLNGQVWKLGAQPSRERPFELDELAHHHDHRPGIAGDVVKGQSQRPLVAPPQEEGPDERSSSQVEPAPAVSPRRCFEFLPQRRWRDGLQVDDRHDKCHLRRNHLFEPIGRLPERGAEGFVPADNLVQRPFNHHGVEIALEDEQRRLVVELAARQQTVEDPHPPLGERSLNRLAALAGSQRRHRLAPAEQSLEHLAPAGGQAGQASLVRLFTVLCVSTHAASRSRNTSRHAWPTCYAPACFARSAATSSSDNASTILSISSDRLACSSSASCCARMSFSIVTASSDDRRRLEHALRREFHLERLAHPRDQLDRQQRVSSEFEELVVDADRRDAEDLLPDLGDRRFGLVPRSHELAAQVRS